MLRGCTFSVALVSALVLGMGLLGCGGGGGGGGGGGSGVGAIIAVSFTGFQTQPSGTGPNGSIPLPTVFIDQVLEFTFDGVVDATNFGGFLMAASGSPVEFTGVSPSTTSGGVPYHAFVNQSLATSSFEVRQNQLGAPVIGSYIVGRHRDKPNTLVVDPRVTVPNPFSMAFNAGFVIGQEHTYRIPANNSLFIDGKPAQPVGISPLLLPLLLPSFGPLPSVSPVFLAGNATGPDPIPPSVVSIQLLDRTTEAVLNPAQPVDSGNTKIRVNFSKAINGQTVNPLTNLVVRNQDLATVSEPNGRLVPGQFIFDPATPQRVEYIPTPTFGPGVSPTQGYSISVAVGVTTSPSDPGNIFGPLQGNPPSALGLANNLSLVFTTAPCPTCDGGVAVVEAFLDSSKRDTTFQPVMAAARWFANQTTGFGGVAISGNPLATFLGQAGGLGTRMQVNMPIGPGTTLPLTSPPPGLFAPFDDTVNNLGAAVNPNGGSHSMWMVDAVDIGSPRSSLELIEWAPVNNTVFASTYPQYRMWCGMTSNTAPIACSAGVGLSTIYRQNWLLPTIQTPDPNNTNPTVPAQGGVLVNGPMPYVAGPGFTSFYPFPVFNPPFDYQGSGTGSGGLIWEVNIEPGNQVANFNLYRATAFNPPRRIIGSPLSLGSNTAANGACDTYLIRFTFVDILSSAQSQFYDTGVAGANARYAGMQITPSPANQGAGSNSLWEFMGANAISNPTTPQGVTSGWLTLWSGTAPGAQFFPEVLESTATPPAPQLTGNRYFRFRTTMRNNPATNAAPFYTSVIASIVITTL